MKQVRQHHTAVVVRVLIPDPDLQSCIIHTQQDEPINTKQAPQFALFSCNTKFRTIAMFVTVEIITRGQCAGITENIHLILS
jgi:hypothetical protein